MATLTAGVSFGATETVTNTKLHNLVNNATITAIVNADIDASAAITDTKLADITSGGKVRGTSILNLPSIPSGAGAIPFANMPTALATVPLGASLVSLVTIPNQSLLPLTLASWVDGLSLRNLASVPTTSGLFNYKTMVSSLASGGTILFDGSNNFIGRSGGVFQYVSGSTVLATALTERTHLSSTYTKVKEITPFPFGGVVDISWDHKSSSSSFAVYSKLYINDVAVGTEKSTTSLTDVNVSESSVSLTPGDKIQIYSKVTRDAIDNVYVNDLIVKSSYTQTPLEASGY